MAKLKKGERFVPPIFEHQRKRSEASKRAAEKRWARDFEEERKMPKSDRGRDFIKREYGWMEIELTEGMDGQEEESPTD